MIWPRAVRSIPVVLLVGALVSLGCGLKADPRGADQVRPRTITSLSGRPQPDGIHLEWQRPAAYANGQRMDDLGGFLVFRGLPGEEAKEIANIPVTDRDRFRPEKTFGYVDKEAGPSATVYYRVISYTTDSYYSLPSNQVTIAVGQ
jgi:hypothetical protein